MKPLEERYIDKSTWGEGAWQEEPDRIEWRYAGLPCLIVRSETGALCGYVGCPPGHPFHGTSDFDALDLEVHGGLSFAGPCNEHAKICHVARPGEPDEVFWLGFDCGHAYDHQPGIMARLRAIAQGQAPLPDRPFIMREWDTYRDVAYVRSEVEALADQIARAGSAAKARAN